MIDRFSRFLKSFYFRVSAVFLLLILNGAVASFYVLANASLQFGAEIDQRLAQNLAERVAAELEPLFRSPHSDEQLRRRIGELEELNKRMEIYLLDATGAVIKSFSSKQDIVRDQLPIETIKGFITMRSDADFPSYIADPRRTQGERVFSAAELRNSEHAAYVLLILGSRTFESVTEVVQHFYLRKTGLFIGGLILLIGLATSTMIFFYLTTRLRTLSAAAESFWRGDLSVRVPVTSPDELGQLASAFNRMADTIAANIEKLRETDRLRRELVSNVSHDLRSPLTAIRGLTEELLDESLRTGARDHMGRLQTLHRNVISLDHLIKELFELSKLDAKEIEMKPEVLPISAFLAEMVEKFRRTASACGVELIAKFPRSELLIEADPFMLERAFSNVLENAIKFTPSGGSVTVSLEHLGDRVSITVSDTGIGIAAEDMPNIFDRYYRSERTSENNSIGCGLGLSIVKKIVEAHEGKISIRSTAHEGTAIEFSLKAA